MIFAHRLRMTVALLCCASLIILLLTLPASSAPAEASLGPNPGTELTFCGTEEVVQIEIRDVEDLYGYEVVMSYDQSVAAISGSFNNSWFDTTANAFPVLAGCADGQCAFAVTKIGAGQPVSGSGSVVTLTISAVASGSFDLTIDTATLSNRDGIALPLTVDAPLQVSVCQASGTTVSGVIDLQGRPEGPINGGEVRLVDMAGTLPPLEAPVDPGTGAFVLPEVVVEEGGSTFRLEAIHPLYLPNAREGISLSDGDNYIAPPTGLRGGDANKDGRIDLFDLACIGEGFSAGSDCAGLGATDIDADGVTGITDITLAAGNYGLQGVQAWHPPFNP